MFSKAGNTRLSSTTVRIARNSPAKAERKLILFWRSCQVWSRTPDEIAPAIPKKPPTTTPARLLDSHISRRHLHMSCVAHKRASASVRFHGGWERQALKKLRVALRFRERELFEQSEATP